MILDINCPDLDQNLKSFLVENWKHLKKDRLCPLCKEVHRPYNGTGPGEFDILGMNVGSKLRWLLKFVPWDVWIQRTAVPFHDWMSSWGIKCGVTFEQCNQVFQELVALDIEYYYQKKVKNMWFPRKTWWRALKVVLLNKVDEICEYFVGSDQTKEEYESKSCKEGLTCIS